MANEFIARKGLIVLANGAKVTGSLGVLGDINATGYNVTASNLQLLGSASIDGDVTIAGNLTLGTADIDVVKFLAEVSSSIIPDVNNAFDLGSGSKYWKDLYVSGTAYIGTVQANNINLDSITVLNNLSVDGSTRLGNESTDRVTVTGSLSATGAISAASFSGSFSGSGAQITNIPNSGLVNSSVTVTAGNGLSGGGSVALGGTTTLTVNTSSAHFISGARATITASNTTGASGITLSYNSGTGALSGSLLNSSVTVTAGSGLSGGGAVSLGGSTTITVDSGSMLPYYSSSILNRISGDILINTASGVATIQPNSVTLGTDTSGDYVASITAGSGISTTGATSGENISHTISVNTSSAHFITGSTKAMDLRGVFSSSAQVDVRQTTGIATIATTGSNTFTGVQTITNTTNSTNYTEGALIVQGGVGIAKDVNISGSLNVLGILTATTMSTQYVTSSQYVVGVSRIILNDDDLVRFGGISVVDSGSTAATGSLLWDSLKNHWIYEREDGGQYRSAVVIAGPKNYGALGNEEELVVGRIPVATGGDHIDTNPASSSIYIDFTNRKTYVEAGLYVTGSVTSSVGFSGDGSQLTGIVSNLNLSGSQGGTGTVALKTQALTVSGSNGIAVTVSGQTVLVSGSDATTTSKGVASFTGSNFTTAGGVVSAKPINFNGVDLNLGSSYAFGIQNITPYGASTSDQLTLSGGAIISSVLYTSANNLDVDTGTEVVATIPTGSYDAAHFDYVVKKGANLRTGTVMVVWQSGTANVEHTDTSTNDLGNTSEVVLTADTLSGNVRLLATVSSTDWIVKTAARLM